MWLSLCRHFKKSYTSHNLAIGTCFTILNAISLDLLNRQTQESIYIINTKQKIDQPKWIKQCWEHCRLKVNYTTCRCDMTSQGSTPYGHSKVVLPSGIVGTVLPRWGASAEVLHYTESLLSVKINSLFWVDLKGTTCGQLKSAAVRNSWIVSQPNVWFVKDNT